MFGSHLSIAGSMVNALLRAEALRFDTVQVFTKNQRQWKVNPLDPGMVRDWLAHLKRLKWQGRVVSHASYLINLAAPSDALWQQSIDLMTVEIERCAALEIPFIVHHPGAYTSTTPEAGIARIGAAYKELFRRTRGMSVISCLEGTTGSGTNLGGPFEHLAALRQLITEQTGEANRIGFCLDTCHLHAAGHDLSTVVAARATLERFDRICGMEHLHVFHINDSKGALGSKLDRHMHIGEGEVGGKALQPTLETLSASGFAAVINHPRVAKIPKILETPKEDDCPPGAPEPGAPKALDSINLERLRAILTIGGKPGPFPPESTSSVKPAKAQKTVKSAATQVEPKPSVSSAARATVSRKKTTAKATARKGPVRKAGNPPI
jgi:deoxyribonuclease-4